MFLFSATIDLYCIALEGYFFLDFVSNKVDISIFPGVIRLHLLASRIIPSMLMMVRNSILNNLYLQNPNTFSNVHSDSLKGETNVFSVDPCL